MVNIPNIIVGELLDYWFEKRCPKDLPRRADIDPVEIPRLLPYLYLLNVLPGPAYEFRLIGTSLVDRLGFDPVGKKVSEIIDGVHLDHMEQLFAKALQSREPIYSHSRYQVPFKEHLHVHRIILPLANEDGDVAMLLVGQKFDEPAFLSQDDALEALRAVDGGEHTFQIMKRAHP